ncbi:aspartate/glutamate racemase family protein [Methylobacterium sp. J-090]|uniref:aspartate/glutamate racemase family protein n=1 Tax=Methylobacterium sp. J-090 TaxID=2836666 RepID=UPI001FB8D789|nr:amino acid racemase [Methylobacterium sp. J-090]MCJ2080086.1 amino acid racemase [Methylobacterium sp. J-090]
MLGILGGMGPMATVDFMRKLVDATPAMRDQDHPGALVLQACDIPDRTRAILGGGPDPLPAMAAGLRRLEAAGATRIAIPCNTAHHWHAALQARTALPILHIVEAVADALIARGYRGGPVGLLATSGTLTAGLYPERLARHGFACVAPEDQDAVMRAIRLAKAGAMAEAGLLLRTQARGLIATGCGQVVLACTEIPLALAASGESLGDPLLDATEALARACIGACDTPVRRAA